MPRKYATSQDRILQAKIKEGKEEIGGAPHGDPERDSLVVESH